jgi:hypothetical protein
MTQATAGFEPSLENRRDPQSAPARLGVGALIAASLLRKGPQRSLTYAIALIAVGAGVFFVTASRPLVWASHPGTDGGAAASVELLALRGGAPGANHAQSRRPLELIIDLTGIGEAEKYRVEIVNATGGPVWNGEAAGSKGSLSAHLTMGLKPGQYWVRLSSRGLLVREFGLRAD